MILLMISSFLASRESSLSSRVLHSSVSSSREAFKDATEAFKEAMVRESSLSILLFSCAKSWELLLAMLVFEAAFGLPGVVAGPIYYAYLKSELKQVALV